MYSKDIYYWWAVPIGLVFALLQPLVNFYGFREAYPYVSLTSYFWFFLAGTAGGLVLITFLLASTDWIAQGIVVSAFLLATPISEYAMLIGGGRLGFLGVVLFPLLPWALISGLGYLIGRAIS